MKKPYFVIPETMKKFLNIWILLGLIIIVCIEDSSAQPAINVFSDEFTGSIMNSQKWHIPTWVSPADGTYLGRTQFRCTQNATLPAVAAGETAINLETYNPTGFSFYGTDLITNRAFSPGNGLIFTIRAKIKTPVTRGMVGGIFLYDLTCACGAIHDEIDFELLTNNVNKVHTNIYSDEPFGTGHPDSASVANPVTEYHTYVIKWLPTEVTWSVDGGIIRTSNISPTGPMHFHLNMWAPGVEWNAAYSVALQPTNLSTSNQLYSMIVDYVRVDSLTAGANSVINEKMSEISFYPNPAHEQINISVPDKIIVSVYNTLGNMVIDKKEVTGSISVADLSPGLYLIKYEVGRVNYTRKIIIE
jgi:beta-glucanase (GH16 family)